MGAIIKFVMNMEVLNAELERIEQIVLFPAARWQRSAWQRGGRVKLGSAAVAFGLAARRRIAASSGHGRACRHQRRAATAHRHGGDEDTGGDSDGGGTNNQQSTKITETAAMTATTITMETKGTAVAAEAW